MGTVHASVENMSFLLLVARHLYIVLLVMLFHNPPILGTMVFVIRSLRYPQVTHAWQTRNNFLQ